MTQFELDRAVAKATMESVEDISGLGFSLLSMPPTHPLAIPMQRRHPIRYAREPRKRKLPRRHPKCSTRSVPVVRAVAKYHDTGANIKSMPLMRLTFFDWGA